MSLQNFLHTFTNMTEEIDYRSFQRIPGGADAH